MAHWIQGHNAECKPSAAEAAPPMVPARPAASAAAAPPPPYVPAAQLTREGCYALEAGLFSEALVLGKRALPLAEEALGGPRSGRTSKTLHEALQLVSEGSFGVGGERVTNGIRREENS